MAEVDRGAHGQLLFRKCERGYTLTTSSYGDGISTVHAFTTIGELTDWLNGQYGGTADG